MLSLGLIVLLVWFWLGVWPDHFLKHQNCQRSPPPQPNWECHWPISGKVLSQYVVCARAAFPMLLGVIFGVRKNRQSRHEFQVLANGELEFTGVSTRTREVILSGGR